MLALRKESIGQRPFRSQGPPAPQSERLEVTFVSGMTPRTIGRVWSADNYAMLDARLSALELSRITSARLLTGALPPAVSAAGRKPE